MIKDIDGNVLRVLRRWEEEFEELMNGEKEREEDGWIRKHRGLARRT